MRINRWSACPLALLLAGSLSAQKSPLTVDKIMRDPKWMGSQPSGIIWGADSKQVYFNWNPDKADDDSLYVTTLDGKAPSKTGIRQRDTVRAQSRAIYNTSRTKLAYVMQGDIFLQDIATGKTTQITSTTDGERNPQFVHNDEWLVYTRSQNLYAWSLADGSTKQLTNFVPGTAPKEGEDKNKSSNTTQDGFIKTEELALMMVVRERKEKEDKTEAAEKATAVKPQRKLYMGAKMLQGVDISPDGRFISYSLYEAAIGRHNTIIPNYVTESGYTEDIPGRTNVGEPLGKQSFYLYDAVADTLLAISMDSLPGIKDLPDYAKDYPARYKDKKPEARLVTVNGIVWNETASRSVLNIFSQDSKDRWIMSLDTKTGKLQLVDRQHDNAWVGRMGSGTGSMGWLNDETLWFVSEKTGYTQLFTTNLSSGKQQQLTKGNYEVQGISLSNDKKTFYMLANLTHPGEQNWYSLPAVGGMPQKITSKTGGYTVAMSPDEKWIAYLYSYTNQPWELFIQENKAGATITQITNKAKSAEFAAYPWRDPLVTTFKASDGQPVYARVYTPEKAKKNGAAVIFVHGAGYLQNAHKWWSSYFREYMFHNLLTDEGYTVLDIDYRGSAGYGRDWRTGIYRHMGGKDLDDEVDGAKWLAKEYGIDASRIGIYGGSYGGFMTLMAMFTKPGVFKAGAALRSVADWAHYNHGYTSNILNEPVNDSLAYRRSSPIYFAEGFTKGRLLMCHGMVDVNVHFQDIVRLSQRLIELKKENWELAVYPVEDHGFVEPTSWTDEYKRILKLFREELIK